MNELPKGAEAKVRDWIGRCEIKNVVLECFNNYTVIARAQTGFTYRVNVFMIGRQWVIKQLDVSITVRGISKGDAKC